MRFKHQIATAFSGLRANKLRAALTILGIVIGVASIILIMAIGQGAQRLILGEISGLGAETFIIRPGQEPKGPSDFGETLFGDSIKSRDIELLRRKENAPDIVDLMPLVIVPGSASFEGETFRPTMIGGVARFMASSFNVFPEQGTLFDEEDIRQRAAVAVIGWKVKQELFGDSDAVGRQIRIKDRKFRVTGVFPKRGQVAFLNMDELIIVPYTTAQQYLLGIDYFNEVIVKTTSPEAVARTVADVEEILRAAHGIDDPDKDDFFTMTQQGLVEQVRVIIRALTAFLSSVVAIALLVGGIGVMNIMLVSVTERTREIGLRKALGATSQDILTQFLLEAVLLTGAGGLIGIFIGAIVAFSASLVLTRVVELNWQFTFPYFAAFLGVFVSAAVGLIFGLYPARRAARKSPIEALRYE